MTSLSTLVRECVAGSTSRRTPPGSRTTAGGTAPCRTFPVGSVLNWPSDLGDQLHAPDATVLDVLDNFFVREDRLDFRTLPGRVLYEFGDEVRRFADSELPPALDGTTPPAYLGGWPSANFWAVHGDLVLSQLLYSGQVLVKDPVVDWFSDDQYHISHKMAARPGYLAQDGTPNVAATRAFLVNVLPSLLALRPLIAAGIVRLVPGERFFRGNATEIMDLQRSLSQRLASDPVGYTREFSPPEVAVEDNVRGMFTFVGGEREPQLKRAIDDGLLHFAREYAFAHSQGAVYIAPFRHEVHLCSEGLGENLSPSIRVAQTLLRSELPIFSGLTPSLIAKLRDDDNFASFRAELHQTYAGAPVEAGESEVAAYIADQEQALLAPRIRQAAAAVDRGVLDRVGISLTGSGFNLLSGLAVDLAAGTSGLGVVAGATKTAIEGWMQRRNVTGSRSIWSALVRHNRSVAHEVSGVQAVAGSTEPSDFWGIPEHPSRTVVVSRGALLTDFVPSAAADPSATHGYSAGSYRACDCGSGLKFKFCCRGIRPSS